MNLSFYIYQVRNSIGRISRCFEVLRDRKKTKFLAQNVEFKKNVLAGSIARIRSPRSCSASRARRALRWPTHRSAQSLGLQAKRREKRIATRLLVPRRFAPPLLWPKILLQKSIASAQKKIRYAICFSHLKPQLFILHTIP